MCGKFQIVSVIPGEGVAPLHIRFDPSCHYPTGVQRLIIRLVPNRADSRLLSLGSVEVGRGDDFGPQLGIIRGTARSVVIIPTVGVGCGFQSELFISPGPFANNSLVPINANYIKNPLVPDGVLDKSPVLSSDGPRTMGGGFLI